MRTTSWIVLSALLLLETGCASGKRPGTATDRDRRAPQQRTVRPAGTTTPPPCRVCVNPPPKVVLPRGKSTKVTWTIAGTTQPVRAHVHNKNPGAVEVQGGDEQYVMSSGGTPNVVTRNVIAKQAGVFGVDVSVDEDEWIATTYRAELRRIAEETKAAARNLKGNGKRTIPAEDVVAALDVAVADVERSLSFVELTAFRDAVREYADQLRREIDALSIAARTHSNAIQLVAQRSSDGSIPAPKARSFLSRLADFLFRSSEVDPLTEVCAVTLPSNGTTLRLYPKSTPDTERPLFAHTTATRFPLYVGLYTWDIGKSTGAVNLLTDPDRILECSRSANDASACDLIFDVLDKRCRQ
jgi:hypothetical protein